MARPSRASQGRARESVAELSAPFDARVTLDLMMSRSRQDDERRPGLREIALPATRFVCKTLRLKRFTRGVSSARRATEARRDDADRVAAALGGAHPGGIEGALQDAASARRPPAEAHKNNEDKLKHDS